MCNLEQLNGFNCATHEERTSVNELVLATRDRHLSVEGHLADLGLVHLDLVVGDNLLVNCQGYVQRNRITVGYLEVDNARYLFYGSQELCRTSPSYLIPRHVQVRQSRVMV